MSAPKIHGCRPEEFVVVDFPEKPFSAFIGLGLIGVPTFGRQAEVIIIPGRVPRSDAGTLSDADSLSVDSEVIGSDNHASAASNIPKARTGNNSPRLRIWLAQERKKIQGAKAGRKKGRKLAVKIRPAAKANFVGEKRNWDLASITRLEKWKGGLKVYEITSMEKWFDGMPTYNGPTLEQCPPPPSSSPDSGPEIEPWRKAAKAFFGKDSVPYAPYKGDSPPTINPWGGRKDLHPQPAAPIVPPDLNQVSRRAALHNYTHTLITQQIGQRRRLERDHKAELREKNQELAAEKERIAALETEKAAATTELQRIQTMMDVALQGEARWKQLAEELQAREVAAAAGQPAPAASKKAAPAIAAKRAAPATKAAAAPAKRASAVKQAAAKLNGVARAAKPAVGKTSARVTRASAAAKPSVG